MKENTCTYVCKRVGVNVCIRKREGTMGDEDPTPPVFFYHD